MKLLRLTIALFMLVPAYSAWGMPDPPADLQWVPAQDRTPADLSVELKNLDGTKFTLEAFRNKVVIVNVWATWCGPCKEEMPSIAELYNKLHAKGFEIIAVTNDNARKVRNFLKQKQFPFSIVLDPKDKFFQRFRVDRVPTTLVIDTAGKLALHHAGVADWNAPEIIEALTLLIPSTAER
jgi:peroxiredoxin